jgi:NADPH:quinone reductase-like Zn-dependent oxidoreductase
VLITGAAGGVGTFAIQIAAARGVRVIAQITAKNADYVTELGAHEWVDYSDDHWVAAARSKADGRIDALLDFVGHDSFLQGCSALRPVAVRHPSSPEHQWTTPRTT